MKQLVGLVVWLSLCSYANGQCAQGDVRLVNGTTSTEGRVEICNSGVWGTVCDDSWGILEGDVVCRQLGLGAATSAPQRAFYGQGTGSIVLDNVVCTGRETTLFNCSHDGVNIHNCVHSEDAGVACSVSVCTQGDVRLVGGTTSTEGRVEVCDLGAWGTVCDDSWSIPDGNVVCQQLGFGPATSAPQQAFYGQGTGAIVLDKVLCTGSEATLFDCPHNGLNSHTCDHSEDAGVVCLECAQGDVRLAGVGSTSTEGRVEVCDSEAWGTVCDDQWGLRDGRVVCRQLELGPATSAPRLAAYGQGTGAIVLDNLLCTGSEATLFDCPHNGLNINNCGHNEDASVICAVPCTQGDVRLAGVGSTNSEGRVEVCDTRAWGTVCDDFWGLLDGKVVCQQLGLGPATSAPRQAAYGRGTGSIVLDNLLCTGSEATLFDCPHNGLNIHNCAHSEDASVVCTVPCTQGDVRLAGDGSTSTGGRVEVCDSGVWGTVCDDFWGLNDGHVVCRQLGLGPATSAPRLALFGQGTGSIVLDNLLCTGSEATLLDCPHNGLNIHNCGHNEDASVVCAVPCCQGDVRLAGVGSTSSEGRVEVCDSGVWGTVCDDAWGLLDGHVACRQLGLGPATSAPRLAAYGQGTGSIVLDNVLCTSSEATLFDCPHNGLNIHNCGHNEDASVVCTVPCTQGDVRLAGVGSTSAEGRVEVCDSGVWGTVCDDQWGLNDGHVVCRQLGLGPATSAPRLAAYGQGTGSIVLDNVLCTGSEATLFDCPHNGLNINNCGHNEDASVVCAVPCTQGDVRLAGVGSTSSEGRVEVCDGGAWGTVCDDSWGINDGHVACRQLGLGPATSAPRLAAYGQGTGSIVLDNVLCTGNEATLFDCPHNGLNINNCGHNEDASVVCAVPCTQGDVRLAGVGSTSSEGRVEVCDSGSWGTVCDDAWGINDGHVVCRQLGLGPATSAPRLAAYGQGTGSIVLDNVACTGSEATLFDCPHNGLNIHNCGHGEDASVVCAVCTQGDVRLAGVGSTSTEGRVEVCNGGAWGTVCDDQWGLNDGQVVCRQLELGPATSAPRLAAYGRGTGSIVLDNLLCTGSEATLFDCPHNGLNINNCGHSEDASVVCAVPCTQGDVRLVGGATSSEGRVEVCNSDVWGTVCDDLWGLPDGQVVCQQLGLGPVTSAPRRAAYGQGTGAIVLDNVACTGSEATLFDCPHNGLNIHNCGHSEDAGVVCAVPCTQGDVRLAGVGSTSTEGRVEVCDSGTWGTVCDDSWGINDGHVACRQLGLGPATSAPRLAAYGRGTGSIVLDNVLCTGSEATLFDCPHNGLNNHNCGHNEDAGVVCTVPCTQGEVRLAGDTSTSTGGRVEVCDSRAWGTVCDDFWGLLDGNVVCRQLGLGPATSAPRLAAYGRGTGSIVLDNLLCTGSEATLFDCPHNGLNIHNCGHNADASVVCAVPCCQGDVRLAGVGSTSTEGRVEVCDSGAWGTVCDDQWGLRDGHVVCRQLELGPATSAPRLAAYGRGTGAIVLDNIICTGSEATLFNCPHNGLNIHNCGHNEDASVVCAVPCTQGDVRLAGVGSTNTEGRVEVCDSRAWGTVCDDQWGLLDGNVVCRQLGLGPASSAPRLAAYGSGTGAIVLDNIRCTGSEATLFDCPHNGVNIHNCGHNEDASVVCSAPCTQGDVRLAGISSTSTEGRVEICDGGAWGTVCDDQWGLNDGHVVCRQLGLGPATLAPRQAAYGPGTGSIVLDNVLCTGSEVTLFDCPHNGLNIHNCAHSEDAGVNCSVPCTQGDIRLVGGATSTEGRVEVCNSGAWGTVCDDAWNLVDGRVACRQLGFASVASVSRQAFYGQGTGSIVLDNLGCTGSEASLFDCTHNGVNIHNCAHSEDAGVSCNVGECVDGDIRLVNGNSQLQGRVEVCNSQQWGTVCDDGFGTADANVACRQLGFSNTGATVQPLATYGAGTGLIILDNLGCVGTEQSLFSCPHNGINNHNCIHFEDVGVTCLAGCTQGAIRLVGGASQYEGRVELCNNNAWGTVCDDAFSGPDANVACGQLGFPNTGAVSRCCAGFGTGTGTILLDQLACTGTESSLFDCVHNGIAVHDCRHFEDVGVICQSPPPECSNGDVRITGGPSEYEGRVEVCDNQLWGTVCDDSWDITDANVVCTQLGYGQATLAPQNAFYGPGTRSIVLDNLDCTGSEATLFDCPHNGLNIHNCVHNEDAGVACESPVTSLCTSGQLRLQSGTYNSGRVEICNNLEWGTICDDSWDQVDGDVACRQLGFPGATLTQCCAIYGQGSGPIILDNLACTGSETSLLDCQHNGVNIHNCGHTEDAGVICAANVRLVNGPSPTEGRVEVYANGAWGTVCDDVWDVNDANVVCMQLGLGPALTFPGQAFYGQGTGNIVLDQLACTGTEASLFDCPHNGLLNHDCSHFEDAGVSCTPVGPCTDGDVRLVGGTNSNEGRVEVCNSGAWGTVCDDLWNVPDASVVCRQLGFAAASNAPCCASFGQGVGDILLDNLGCTGSETSILDCLHNGINVHNCVHSEDAGAICIVCNQGDIRLVGGQSEFEGRVEVCNNDEWGTVCDDSWGAVDAAVACRQLGYGSALSFPGIAFYGQGTGSIVLDQLACTGTEISLFDCPHNGLNNHDCVHFEDAGLSCGSICMEGDLRLVNGPNEFAGRVEFCHNNVWGTVCDDRWGANDAAVVCRQLGYTGGSVPTTINFYGSGADPIWLDEVGCTGSETSLLNCPHSTFGSHDCSHFEDAGVICSGAATPPSVCTQGDIRLVNGNDERQGRVEVCNDNAWGTVCDDLFGSEEARVACVQLGFSGDGATAQSSAAYGQGTGNIVLDDVICTGNEASIFDCPNSGINIHNCGHSEDVGIMCLRVCSDGDLRLIGGLTNRQGRVEICSNEVWGTVCDDFWGGPDANVVCYQLGYGRTGLAVSFAAFGQGTGPIFLDNVGCTGMENRLIECSHIGIGTHNCQHSEDASVICTGSCTDGDVRLVGGSNQYEGRVELCRSSVWGTVCDDLWDSNDAMVVCQQLGYSNGPAQAFSQAFFGEGTGDIFLDDVACSGSESRLVDCTSTTLHNCAHFEDASVRCPSPTPAPDCTDFELRLVGGTSDLQGRVEICMNNVWGTVCDDFWDATDAAVVCGQLGYSRDGAVAHNRAFFGQGTGSIFIDDVRCTGAESSLQECPYTSIHNCAHIEDAGVTCLFCQEGGLRLVNGPNDYTGRVEVCNNQEWGTVCDDSWDSQEANVACRQAGYSRFGATALSFATYGQGTGPIVLDDLECVGTEDSLFNCPHNGVLIHNCAHSEDASVNCTSTLFCNGGDVRIVNGPANNIGRIEICVNEEWGTICSDDWNTTAAGIVCAQRGYSRFNASAIPFAQYGMGTGPIFLDGLNCAGTEGNLLNCPRNDLIVRDCSHSLDASVECQIQLLCEDGDIRLVGGSSPLNGRVEVCHNEEWGTVCDDFWSNEDAAVVCRQAGYSDTNAIAVGFAAFGQGTGPIILDDVQCVGNETNLFSCPSSGIRFHNCIHFEDAGVRCQAIPLPCVNGDLRLANGAVEGEGRVEFCQNEVWGTVCDDFWSINDANVVCHQLGYVRDGSNTAYSSAFFGPGTGEIFLDNLLCTGNEERLDECTHNGVGVHNCDHSEDAGVACQQCVDGDIRLVGGSNQYEGRVEVCVASVWGTVCDDQWDVNDAMVACRQANLPIEGATATRLASFGPGSGPIVLDDLQCLGSESSLFDCTHSGINIHNCVHIEDAGVVCQLPTCQDRDVRLRGGNSSQEGRLEVCSNNEWYSVCDTTFSETEASVVCRQLGFSRYHAEATSGSSFGPSTTMPLFDNTVCVGDETTSAECNYTTPASPSCSNFTEAGVVCRTELVCEQFAIRLVGGTIIYEGRVELCIDETWHSVCADGAWTNIDANVACREAGYAATGATAVSNAFFGQGVGPIYPDDFLCFGTESRLFDCPIDTFGACLGGHLQDAGVRCNEGCVEGNIRLVGGSNENEGRVEVCVGSSWGTVCDDFWDANDAAVVCGQLGLSRSGAIATSLSFFGQGSGSILLDDVHCIGSEARLIDCTHNQQHNCIHFEDAGVTCQGCVPGAVRLLDGSRPSQGRVEVCMNNLWGTVCDNQWGLTDATVVCRQLGYSVIGALSYSNAFYGPGTTSSPILLDDVGCSGVETRLVNCPRATTVNVNCDHNDDSGVSCSEIPICNDGGLRLVGGNRTLEGRLEVCMNEVWGTICDDAWDNAGANVACRQLGFSRFNATAYGDAQFGPGSGPIYYDNVQCSGLELRLEDCFLDTDASECTHSEDASLRCSSTLFCQNGEIRLADGGDQFEGRIEFCYDETWGTICDGAWSTQDADVACRQLGYQPSAAVPLYNAHFGQGTGPVWLDDLFCTGSEERLLDCLFPGINNIDFCNGHADDAGVRCMEGCVNGDVRLADGSRTGEGRVEICQNQHWGTVCNDRWDDQDASVVCKQLGFSRFQSSVEPSSLFGPGTGTIHLDSVACTGMEDTLLDCVYDMDTSDCTHTQDAGIICQAELRCNDGDLRLVGTSQLPGEGRIEICIGEIWGTICDNNWSNTDASVACRALGFSRFGAMGLGSAAFGPGTGDIVLNSVECTGTETSLLDCPNSMITTTCNHNSDASIRCNAAPVCQDGQIRLITPVGFANNSGRVEVCYNEQWGTVCDTDWTQVDANVACGQLGFSRYNAIAATMGFYGQGNAIIHLSSIACVGNEPRLIDCTSSNAIACSHTQDAGVNCSTTFVCDEGDVRLVGSTVPAEGRAEICIDETWSTICDDGWSLNDANVICRQLGYLGQNSVIYSGAVFGQGDGPIAITSLLCSGSEQSILDCSYSRDTATCTHSNDASLTCQEICTSGNIRLVGGPNQYEGRVEVCLEQQWGTVCDDFWDTNDANVACKQLGFSENNATALLFAPYGQGTGPIWLDNIACLGFEDFLVNCTYDADTTDCVHSEDAGVRCQACSNGDIRLEGGSTLYDGRVEVCQDQTWGTICDNGWTNVDAAVACRQHGYSAIGATALSGAQFGQGFGPIYTNNIACTGSELLLSSCPAGSPVGCTHSQDAGISCQFPPVCDQNEIRLRGGQSEVEGRLEICHLEAWGTVCDNQWTNEDASVVCKQLGFSKYNAYANGSAVFGEGSGPIYGTNVICTGEEESVTECQFSTTTIQCSHANDAGVTCSNTLLCQDGDIRLVNGPDVYSGRVEVCDDETWGTVCDDIWFVNAANVACKQLGFAPLGATPQYAALYGQGSGPIFLDFLLCSGMENRLVDCSHNGIGNTDMCVGGHASDAGVVCGPACNSGDIRIVNGNSSNVGRVEVCKDQSWGTVCDDSWTVEDANVACRQAGFSGIGAVAQQMAFYGQGTGLIHLDDLMCTGTEESLFDCVFNPTHNCGHNEDAGVICRLGNICEDGDIRLCDRSNCGLALATGRVEICETEVWRPICSNSWTTSDAIVACSQLSFSVNGATAITEHSFGAGEREPNLGGFLCSGSEANLTQCVSSRIDDCMANDVAAIQCEPRLCLNGDVRIVDGTTTVNPSQGLVEVCWNEEWGTICDNGYDSSDALVICRQAGFSTSGVTAILGTDTDNTFDPVDPDTNVFIDNLACSGTETNILSCQYTGIGGFICPHVKDAAIRCTVKQAYPTNVIVNAVSNTSLSVSWERPVEFNSTLIKYSTVCNGSTPPDTNNTSVLVVNLNPYTMYRCCVEAVYFDPSENAMACGMGRTNEGIPGAPINLDIVALDANTCSSVTLTWDPPAEDERNGIIAGYQIQLNQGNVPLGPFTSTVNSFTVTGLSCCQDYQFSVSARTSAGYGPIRNHQDGFRTLADLSTPIQVSVNVISDTSITVGWSQPDMVTNQHINGDTYSVRVSPECLNGENRGGFTQVQTINYQNNPVIRVDNIEPLVPYRVILSAVICNSQVNLYNDLVITKGAIAVAPPTLTVVTRLPNDPSTVRIEWESDDGVIDVSYYAGETYDPAQLVRTVPANGNSIQISSLDVCTTYWFRARTASCGSEAFSNNMKLELEDTTLFILDIDLDDDVICSQWISGRSDSLISQINVTLINTLSTSCSYSVDCFAGSQLSCSSSNSKTAVYSTTLVGNIQVDSGQQESCLLDWSRDDGVIMFDDGTSSQARGREPTSTSTGLPGYGIALIIVFILILVIVILSLVVLIILVRKRKTKDPNHSTIAHGLMDDQNDTHSIGMMENPIYADDDDFDDMASYDGRGNKAKEAEAELDVPPMSVNFDPPGVDDY